PSFSEENYGFKQFRRFLEQAERDGIIKLKALGDGENRVKLAGAGKRARDAHGEADEVPEPAPRRRQAPTVNKNREAPPAERNREVPAADKPAEAAQPDPAELQKLSGTLVCGVDLTRKENGAADLSELAHCCKRLDPQLSPERYGVAKSRG